MPSIGISVALIVAIVANDPTIVAFDLSNIQSRTDSSRWEVWKLNCPPDVVGELVQLLVLPIVDCHRVDANPDSRNCPKRPQPRFFGGPSC
eukprot:2043633-Amphidinium_carterae.2